MKKMSAVAVAKQENLKKVKVDLFQKDPAFRNRVADFMQKKVWGITLRVRAMAEIKEAEASILGLEKLMGSVREEHAKESIKALNEKINAEREKLNKQLEEEAMFVWTEQDNAFFKAYQNAVNTGEIRKGMLEWFNHYGLDVSNNDDFVALLMNAISGERKANTRTVVRSNATEFTMSKRTKTDVMMIFYGKLAEVMLAKGALKAEVIPEDVREAYAPKKKTNK